MCVDLTKDNMQIQEVNTKQRVAWLYSQKKKKKSTSIATAAFCHTQCPKSLTGWMWMDYFVKPS